MYAMSAAAAAAAGAADQATRQATNDYQSKPLVADHDEEGTKFASSETALTGTRSGGNDMCDAAITTSSSSEFRQLMPVFHAQSVEGMCAINPTPLCEIKNQQQQQSSLFSSPSWVSFWVPSPLRERINSQKHPHGTWTTIIGSIVVIIIAVLWFLLGRRRRQRHTRTWTGVFQKQVIAHQPRQQQQHRPSSVVNSNVLPSSSRTWHSHNHYVPAPAASSLFSFSMSPCKAANKDDGGDKDQGGQNDDDLNDNRDEEETATLSSDRNGGGAGSGGYGSYFYSGGSEEESDEERFESNWPHFIQNSDYRRLVLPPTCRRVEKPHRTQTTSTKPDRTSSVSNKDRQASDNHQHKGGDGVGDDDEEENPVLRLQNYFHFLLYLLRSLVTYDYAGAAHAIWLGFRRLRLRRQPPPPLCDDNDDNDEQHFTTQAPEATAPQRQLEPDSDKAVAATAATDTDGNHDADVVFQSPTNEYGRGILFADENAAEHDDGDDDHAAARRQKQALHMAPPLVRLENGVAEKSSWSLKPSQEQQSVYFEAAVSSSSTQQQQQLQPNPNDSVDNNPEDTAGKGARGESTSDSMDTSPTEVSSHKSEDGASLPNSPMAGGDELLPVPDDNEQMRPYENEFGEHDDLGQASQSANGPKVPAHAGHSAAHSLPDFPTKSISTVISPYASQKYFFETANSTDSLKKLSVEVPVADKNGYILGDDFLPDSRFTPLLVFVNSRSGPQQGHVLVTQLRRLLNPIQVWDLSDGPPDTVLESFCVLTRMRILVCGGDGTVSWIISALEKLHLQRKWPPIAILPLGTGNDLARIHGWGGGYSNEPLMAILKQIAESYISLLDRWELTITDHKHHHHKHKEVKNFFNYLGVGADAQAALQVHNLRESRPAWFFSRMVNKAWYGLFGAEDILMASSVHVRKEIKLIADGVEIPLPSDSQGIILLNIDSYAGGVPLWSHGTKPEGGPTPSILSLSSTRFGRPRRSHSMSEFIGEGHSMRASASANSMDRVDSLDDFTSMRMSDEERHADVTACDKPSSCQDGLLDVVSIRGAFHLGQIKVGLSNAQRLCQCREATIIIKNKVAVQVDGEPWRQRPCTLRIKRKDDPAIMLHRSAADGGVETEMSKLLDWAEDHGLIDGQVHSTLMKEFSRRIESKTRQRRIRSARPDNIMKTLKKAISSSGMTNTTSTGA